MDYEKKYKETLERAKQLLGTSVAFDRFTIERIFPELKENKMEWIEKIRQELKSYLEHREVKQISESDAIHQWIAWLEKQGEQNLIMADSPQLGDQKPTDKFKVGDWVVSGQFVTQIREIAGDGYVNSHNGFISFEGAKNYHLWTIQDAKDGDVLSYRDGQWIFIYKGKLDDNSFYYHTLYSTIHQDLTINDVGFTLLCDAIIPATKEQRDTLFAKMKEAGYAFDFEKKELKKLGQPEVTKTSDQEEIAEIPFGAKDSELQEATYYIPKGFYAEIKGDIVLIKKGKQKPEWSEEDERNIQNIDSVLFYDKTLPEDTCVKLRNFLKTLKERIGWKPSEEQISSLRDVIYSLPHHPVLFTLYNDLKKLKGE